MSESESEKKNTLSHFIQVSLSYDSNIMLAAIISLLLVILFVLLLNIYARWFLVQARQRSRSSVTVPANVLGSRFHRFTIMDSTSTISDDPWSSPNNSKGLHPSLISSLPLFVYYYNSNINNNPNDDQQQQQQNGFMLMECAICLSSFQEEEVGRKLPKCAHAFHVECIDMWLHSHSTCPVCRASVVLILCDQDHKMINHDQYSVPETAGSAHGHGDALHLEIDLVVGDHLTSTKTTEDVSAPGVSSNLESSLGGSLKRILSTNRTERKVHPSADNGNVSQVQI